MPARYPGRIVGISGYTVRPTRSWRSSPTSPMVGAQEKGARLVAELEAGPGRIRRDAARLPQRPKVYFEEWDEPMISAIRWVSELVGIAGGDDLFPEKAASPAASGRLVTSEAVLGRSPEIISGWARAR